MHGYKRLSTALVIIGFAAAAIWGCGGGGNGPGYDARANLDLGWNYFADGDYDSAVDKFEEVMGKSAPDSAESFLGRGWCRTFTAQYSSGISDFNNCLRLTDSGSLDAYMGLAGANRDLPNYQLAISSAVHVIEGDSDYVFLELSSIDFMDAHLIMAQCYYRLGSSYFDEAHVQVNYLCELLLQTPLPDPGTMPAQEYEQALADKIELLSGLISA